MPPPVLIAYDGHATSPVRLGRQLAELLGLPLHVATAYHYEPATLGARLETAETALAALSLPPDTVRSSLPADDPAPELLRLAVRLGAAAVVVGDDRHGHVRRSVAGHATCPVAVAPHDPLLVGDGLRAIGVAFDGTVASRFALTAAERLALAAGARLDVIAVAADHRRSATLRAQVDDAVAGCAGDTRALLRRGRAAEELRRACEDLDLLVCGSRGRDPLLGIALGGVSSHLVEDPVCPVLAVPVRARRDPAAPLGLTVATRS